LRARELRAAGRNAPVMRIEPNGSRAVARDMSPAVSPDVERVVATPCHVVQFYDSDTYLSEAVADFLAPPLAADEPVLVIATPEHLAGILSRFEERKIDLQRARRLGYLTCVDAQTTLSAFMVGETPDATRFRATLRPILEKCATTNARGTVHAYGEMVELLASEGNIAGAIRLEELWTELGTSYSIALLCGYSMRSFPTEAHREAFRAICEHHEHVVPAEERAPLGGRPRAQDLAILQQCERALATEMGRCRKLERRLKDARSERHSVEAKLREAQRLESIGVLAGGIAHDFNNLLTGILGNADLLRHRLVSNSDHRVLTEEIVLAARRAADLTKQLLAYAGRGHYALAPVDIGALAREVASLLRTAIPTGGELTLEIAENLPAIFGDRAQMTQVLMNLVTNAADALPETGGSVAVRVRAESLDSRRLKALAADEGVADAALQLGLHVCIEVSDTGVGMAADVRSRMFEPFFSTKPTGRGLGLAATRGIIKAHSGAATVDSYPGRGTTIRVWLPAYDAASSQRSKPTGISDESNGDQQERQLVLIVDDDPIVRRILSRMLTQQGYEVLECADGKEALAVVDERSSEIDLVLLDLTMPVLGGAATLEALSDRHPEIPVILMSGYSEEPLAEYDGNGIHPVGFLPKPFESNAVLRTVAGALSTGISR
jgi:signal transduction histidine kinase/CheY-like chemotaxis protein